MNGTAVEPASEPSPEYTEWLANERHALQCRVELSAAYHSKHERFLLLCERFSQATAALTATAAFTQTVGATAAGSGTFALVAALASILPLVFGWASAANRHATLAATHRRLLAQLAAEGTYSEEQLTKFRAQLLNIEADEQASLGALVVVCQNEQAVAQGHRDKVVPVPWYQRLTMHVIDWDIAPNK